MSLVGFVVYVSRMLYVGRIKCINVIVHDVFRCFYIAEVLAGLRRWREAGAMYQRAESYARQAQSRVATMKEVLTQLLEEVDRARYSSLAHAVLEDDSSDTPQTVTTKARNKVS